MKNYTSLLIPILLILCLLVAGCTGSSTREGKSDTESGMMNDMDKTATGRHIDSFDLEYVTTTKHVNVYLVDERAIDGEHFRNNMAWATFSTMEALTKHAGEIDSVTIIGKTMLVDSKGNEHLDKVYQADVSMKNAQSTNWPNLINWKDLTAAIKNNFDNVWWHQAVTS